MTSSTAPRGTCARLATAALLIGGLLLSGCSGEPDDEPKAGTDSSAGSAGEPAPVGAAPDEQAADRLLDGLGKALEFSLDGVESYDVDGSTLTVHFASGSKDDVSSRCVIATTAAQSLTLPDDYELVMSYPDGKQECAR